MKRLLATAAAVFFALPAAAQQCGPYEQVRQVLSERYGEQMAFMGKANDGRYIMVWGNPDGRSWTIIVTDGSAACLIASGTEHQTFAIGDPA